MDALLDEAGFGLLLEDGDFLLLESDSGITTPVVASVKFGGINALSFTVDSPTQITATTPPGAAAGPVDTVVTSNLGSSAITPDDVFEYLDAAPVMEIVAITTPDAVVHTDFTDPIDVWGTISVAWAGVDTVDAVLPSTFLTRADGGPFIVAGVLGFIYGASFDTVLLGDGPEGIEAHGINSLAIEGVSPVVYLRVNNGTPIIPPGLTNPDFEHQKALPAITQRVHALLEQPGIPAEVARAVTEIVADVDANNRRLEDYLNRDVVRRVWATEVLGDDTLHHDTGWVPVVPLVQFTIQKASPRSQLIVKVSATGRAAGSVEDFMDFGVNIAGIGYDHDLRVVRGLIVVDGAPITVTGSKPLAADAPAGTFIVTLLWRGQNNGVYWRSLENGSISLSVTEVPSS